MGGKSKGGGKKSKEAPTCAGCKNFKPGAKGSGRCIHRDKKRSPDDKACDSFKKR